MWTAEWARRRMFERHEKWNPRNSYRCVLKK